MSQDKKVNVVPCSGIGKTYGTVKRPAADKASALLDQVKIYNVVPGESEGAYLAMLQQEYDAFCAEKELVR